MYVFLYILNFYKTAPLQIKSMKSYSITYEFLTIFFYLIINIISIIVY